MHPLQSATVILLLVSFVSFEIEGRNLETSNCGKSLVEHKPLITGGSQTSHWPWHAAIYHQGKKHLPEYQCGGTLINANSVLTAAHCISKNNKPLAPSIVSVSLGRLNLDVDESISVQSFETAKISQHPNYTSIDLANDIAIIRLSTDATFNNYVQPVCMWPSNKLELAEVVGRKGTVVGWGLTETGEISNLLQQASMPVVDSIKCLESNRRFFGIFLSSTTFCAGFRNGKSNCQGDSGGSMTFEDNGLFYIRGIVSLGAVKEHEGTLQRLCDSNQFAIFTDVAQYLPWIDEVVSNECEINVQCDNSQRGTCSIYLIIWEQKCKIIFADSTNTEITRLTVGGTLEALPDLSDALAKFKNLNALELSGNNIKTVDGTKLAAFKRIESLHSNDNQITEFEFGTFDEFKNLRELHLNNNNLTEIDRNLFSELSELKELRLSENQLNSLPPDVFRNNSKLEKLSVHNNYLTEIDRNLFSALHNLTYLNLEDNQLEILPQGLLSNNTKLEQIWAANNKIKKIESDFQHLKNIVMIDLRRNECTDWACSYYCHATAIHDLIDKIENNCHPN